MENSIENTKDSITHTSAVDVRRYRLLNHGEVSIHDLYSHPLARVVDPKDNSIWFRKLMESYQVALHEVLARHLIRLYDPLQPNTILGWHPRGVSYVLSEEVPHFHHLPHNQSELFERNVYPGLGRALILSIIFFNTDLKDGNVGLGEHTGEGEEVVKIVDGDWFFAPFRDPDWYAHIPNTISSELIDQLPSPGDFYAYHWLDYIQAEHRKNSSAIVSGRLSKVESFRLEINQIILKCLLTPTIFLNALVKSLLPSAINSDNYIEFIQERFLQLKQSALENKSFQSYLKTRDAQITAKAFGRDLEQYCVQNNYNLFSHINCSIFQIQFIHLKKEWLPTSLIVSPISKFKSPSSDFSFTLSPDSPSGSVFSNLDDVEENEDQNTKYSADCPSV